MTVLLQCVVCSYELAGICGDHICATNEMPDAQNLGLFSAPGICLLNSGDSSPLRWKYLHQPFRIGGPPLLTSLLPPPPSRCHFFRLNLPGGIDCLGPS